MSISSTLIKGAEIEFHAAAPELRAHVGCFWIVRAEPGAFMRMVPDGTTSLAFKRSEFECLGYLRGPSLRPMQTSYSAPTTLIGVRLRPGVAFSLTEVSVHRFVNRQVTLESVETLREWANKDWASKSSQEIIAALQHMLIERLAQKSLHPIVEQALAQIHSTRGDILISDLATRCETSERHLGRLMRQWIGYGPKRYAAIVRFQSSLAEMKRAPQLPVASLATETGYFDQSHMSAEVMRLSGDTPRHLIQDRVSDFSKTHCEVPF